MERTRAATTNILALKTVKLTVPLDSAPKFWSHIFPSLPVDSTGIKRNMEKQKIPVKPIRQKLVIGTNHKWGVIHHIHMYDSLQESMLPRKLLLYLSFPLSLSRCNSNSSNSIGKCGTNTFHQQLTTVLAFYSHEKSKTRSQGILQ